MADRPPQLVTPARLLLAAGWVIVGGAAIAVATQPLGTPTSSIAALQALTPWALPPVVGTAVAATWRRHHRLGFAAALVGFAYLALTAPLAFPARGPAVAEGSSTIDVVAANVLYSNDRTTEVGDVVLGSDADVLALAEVTPRILSALENHAFAGRYPYRVERVGPLARGLVIWSRLPIDDNVAPGVAAGVAQRTLEATVATPDGPIRLVLVHPPPPVFNHELWATEIAALPAIVEHSETPTVILGDFNATIFHPPYRSAVSQAGLVDALPASGSSLAMTWPTDEWMPPFVAIDHVLVERSLAVGDAGTFEVPGADHRAVWATVGFAASD